MLMARSDLHPASDVLVSPICPDRAAATRKHMSRGLARLSDAIQPRRVAPPTGSTRTQREEAHMDGGTNPEPAPPDAKRRRRDVVEEERPLSIRVVPRMRDGVCGVCDVCPARRCNSLYRYSVGSFSTSDNVLR